MTIMLKLCFFCYVRKYGWWWMCYWLPDNAYYFNKESIFSHFIIKEDNYSHIAGSSDLVEGFGRAVLMLPNRTPLQIKNAIYSSKSMRNLLSLEDIRLNGFHLQTVDKKGKEYHYITQIVSNKKHVLESFLCISSGLYFTCKVMESHTVLTWTVNDPKIVKIWHERLGHSGAIMMHQIIITSSHGHPLKDYKILTNNEYICLVWSMGKPKTRPPTT